MENRIGWIDSWKGMLIILVVLGHVVGALAHYTTGAAQATMVAAYKSIYLFHMPAFFVLVGVVEGLRGPEDHAPFGTFVKKRARRLLAPYAIWGVISVVVFLFATTWLGRLGVGATDGYYRATMTDGAWWRPFLSLLHAGGWPNGEGFRCNSVLWFLPCMFVTLCAMRAVATRRVGALKIGCLAVGLLVLGGVMRFYVGSLPWCLDRAPRFLAFILIGRLISSFFQSSKFHSLQASFVLSASFVVVSIQFPDLGVCWHSWGWYFAEVVMAVWGTIVALMLARAWDGRLLRELGVVSLGIMLIHKFPLVVVQLAFPRLFSAGSSAGWNTTWGVGIVALVSAALVTAFAYLAARLTRKHLF